MFAAWLDIDGVSFLTTLEVTRNASKAESEAGNWRHIQQHRTLQVLQGEEDDIYNNLR